MTLPQTPGIAPVPPPEPPPPPRYVPPAGSRAEDLLGRLETAKARKRDAERQVAEADELVRTIKAALANEVTAAYPGQKVIDIAAGPYRPAFRMRWVTPTKINRDRLQEEHPAAYAACLEWGKPYWDLRKGGS